MKNQILLISLTVLLLVIMAGCLDVFDNGTPTDNGGNSDQNILHLNQQFNLKIGESATIPGEALTTIFFDLEQDSRCPKGVSCVWQGEAVLDVDVVKNGDNIGRVILSTRDADSSKKNLGEYTVQLVSLSPYPEKDKDGNINPIKKQDYVATFIVKKK